MLGISEEQRCIGQDDSPCTADDVAGFDFLAYKEPPPPYSSPHQTLDRRFDPPPYESMRADDGTLHDRREAETGNYNDAATLSPVQSNEACTVGPDAGFSSRVWCWALLSPFSLPVCFGDWYHFPGDGLMVPAVGGVGEINLLHDTIHYVDICAFVWPN